MKEVRANFSTWAAVGVALLVWSGPADTARAEEADPAQEHESAEVPAQEQPEEALPETLDGDPRSRSLRYADRREVLFRIGVGGNFKDAFGKSKAKTTFGATLRWDRPVHEYITTGLGFSAYSAKPEGEFREPAFDNFVMLKGRYPFQMGKKERKFESEVYVLTQIGLTIWIDSSSIDLDLIGPGWNVSIAPGYQFFFNDRVGLLAEAGWIRTEVYFSRGRLNMVLNQAVIRIGAVFPF